MKLATIHLSDHFTYRKILRFTLSPILMMLFTSIYWIVDGFFISNYISTSAFAGVNLIFPVIMIVACVGFMFGSGGAALVSKYLGEGNKEKANQIFSLITYVTFISGIILTAIFFFLIKPITIAFANLNSVQTTEEMIDAATLYGRIMTGGISIYIMQLYYHSFFSVNEKNFIGFLFTLVAGVLNMFLDYLLIGVFGLGVIGAATASLSGMLLGFIGPTLYFRFSKTNLIRLGKPCFDIKAILKSITNGSSEFVSNISGSIINIVFNIQLLKYIGENGVSAYGIIAYVCFVFFAIYIGYSVGISPVIAYNLGAKNHEEMSNVLRKSFVIIFVTSIFMTVLAIAFADPISYIFTNMDEELHQISTRAMRIYSICYLFVGFSMFGSNFFTALNNGIISALISFCRTLVFQLIAVFMLPLIMGIDGIWVSILVAEFLSMIMTIILIYLLRRKYGYKFIRY